MAQLIAPFDPQDPKFYLIECAAHDAPWSRQSFVGCHGKHYRTRALWVHGKPVGFTICQVVAGEVTLMNIAVHPDQQGQGFGRLLMDDLMAFVSDQNGRLVNPIFLEVRESNQSAIALYRKLGFRDIGRRPRYYPPIPPETDKETALVMRL